MNQIKQFLSNHSISAKTVASIWLFITGLWYASPQFHDYVLSGYNALPKGVHGFLAGVAIPALIFWRSQKAPASSIAPPANPAAKLLAIFGVLALLLPMAGCKTVSVTGQPLAPTQGYQQAAQSMSNFATDLQSVQAAEINLHRGGAIDKSTHNTIQATLKQVSIYGKQIDALILAQASAVTITAKIIAALDSVNSIALQTGQLDPNTATQLTTSITAFKLLLNTVIQALPTSTAQSVIPISMTEVKTHGPNNYRNVGRAASSARHQDLQPGAVRKYSGHYLAAIG